MKHPASKHALCISYEKCLLVVAVFAGAISHTALASAETTPPQAAPPATEPGQLTPTDKPPEPPPAPATPAAAPMPVPEAPAPNAFTPLKIDSANATIKLGLLAQPQFETAGVPETALHGASNSLYLRRIRLLVGGTLFKSFEYFFDTDSPNLFKATAAGVKGGLGLNVQDAFITYKAYEDYFKVDAGYMLPPGAHNALQGAGTLYGLDYFSNSFRHAGAFNSPGDVGRDTGLQLRGIVADGRLEYRAGAFEGVRDAASATQPQGHNFFRLAARVQVNVLDPETAYFYAGTYLGKKQVLSFGAAYDFQDTYHHWGLDGFLDMPLGPGSITAQVNVAKWNGGTVITTPAALPNQVAFMGEAGYRFDDPALSPIVRFEYRTLPGAAVATHEARYALGLAYWPYGHNINLKTFFTRVQPTPAQNGYNDFQLQWQLYFY